MELCSGLSRKERASPGLTQWLSRSVLATTTPHRKTLRFSSLTQLFFLAQRPRSAGGRLTLPGPPPWVGLQAADYVQVCSTCPSSSWTRGLPLPGLCSYGDGRVQEERSNCAWVISANIPLVKASHVTKLEIKGKEG